MAVDPSDVLTVDLVTGQVKLVEVVKSLEIFDYKHAVLGLHQVLLDFEALRDDSIVSLFDRKLRYLGRLDAALRYGSALTHRPLQTEGAQDETANHVA